jgi:hypothetical protein
MKNQILIILVGITLLSFTSAIIIFGGENYSFEVNMTNPVFTVIDNTSNLDGMNITFNGTHISLETKVNMKPDNFTLIFIDNISKEVVNTIYVSSGGHSHTITKVVNNTIIKIKDIPFYLTNTTNPENITITKEVPIETNKIPLWAWIFIGIEAIIIILLLITSYQYYKVYNEYKELHPELLNTNEKNI